MKLAFAVKDLSHTQLSYYIVRAANAFLSKRCDVDIMAFFEEPSCSSVPLLFSTMQFAEAWAYDGKLVATSLSSAQKALGFPCVSKRYFLVWELEWVNQQVPFNFRQLRNIYASPRHKLLARTEEHADILEDVWNVERPLVVSETNIVEEILRK